MRNWTFGAKALSIRPPATITPLKMVTGRAPKLSTQALQTGPEGEENGDKKASDDEGRKIILEQGRCCVAVGVGFLDNQFF